MFSILMEINRFINPEKYLELLHSKLRFKHGKLTDEYPEQIMAVKYIEPDDKVLEIGANFGRNSLIISSLLNDSSNLVSMETLKKVIPILRKHRRMNKFKFHIENTALSNDKLIQKGWKCFIHNEEIIPEGFIPVNIISYQQLKNKYQLDFNVLVLDCEGAFYFIIKSFPNILKNIKTIIIENDFLEEEHQEYVENKLKELNFKNVYSQNLIRKNKIRKEGFYKVWQR